MVLETRHILSRAPGAFHFYILYFSIVLINIYFSNTTLVAHDIAWVPRFLSGPFFKLPRIPYDINDIK
jgi:hypothetical protein